MASAVSVDPRRDHRSLRGQRHRARHRAASRHAKDWLLGSAGVLGGLALVWLGLSWSFGLTIVVLQTGSMAPGMPAGTAAVVHEVAPETLTIGDVATVQRPDAALPVTHRVIAVESLGDGIVRLELQGDANIVPDFEPYYVTEAKRVLVAVPGIGHALETLRTPLSLGIITLFVAGLVVWAFWPPGEREP